MTSFTSNPFNSLVKKLRVHGSNLFDKDTVELVFTIMLIFMLTCIGSMLMICFFFEMEKRETEAILVRQPQLVLVDDLAHTNFPGSCHESRYQDVEVLLAAGLMSIPRSIFSIWQI